MPCCGEIQTVLPFVIVGWLTLKVIKETGDVRSAWGVLLAALIILGLNCVWGYYAYQSLALEKRWTPAAFAVAFMYFRGIFVALLAWIVTERIIRRAKESLVSSPGDSVAPKASSVDPDRKKE